MSEQQHNQGQPSSPFARIDNPGQVLRDDPFRSGPAVPPATSQHHQSTEATTQQPRVAPSPAQQPAVPQAASAAPARAAETGATDAEPTTRQKLGEKLAKARAGMAGAAQVMTGKSEARPADGQAAAPGKRTRKARLRLSRIDPWSVMKTSLLFSIAFGILNIVAVWVLWGILQGSGAFDSINRAVNDLLSTPQNPNSFDLGRYVTGARVVGYTVLISVADVIIFTALATLFSFLYNLSATVLGGLEVTLAED